MHQLTHDRQCRELSSAYFAITALPEEVPAIICSKAHQEPSRGTTLWNFKMIITSIWRYKATVSISYQTTWRVDIENRTWLPCPILFEINIKHRCPAGVLLFFTCSSYYILSLYMRMPPYRWCFKAVFKTLQTLYIVCCHSKNPRLIKSKPQYVVF